MKIVIIGGGPAGIMAAISAKTNYPNYEVIIIEKNSSLGKKLLITGKGRCNITNGADISEFIQNIPGNGMFLFSVFNNFDNRDIMKLLEDNGVKTKVERGNRVFPISDKSSDVLRALEKQIKKLNISIKFNYKVNDIKYKESNNSFIINNEITADKLIIATGGKTYPGTGSTGDGYEFAKKMGHTITSIRPSLVPLEIKEKEECKDLQGLSLKNVNIEIKENKKLIYTDFGEMIFTHFGISGPIILSSSAHLIRHKNIDKLLKEGKIKIYIDLKPALTEEQLNLRILRDFKKNKNKEYKNSLDDLLPRKMIDYIIKKSRINPNKKVNEITKEERKGLVELIKKLEFTIERTRPIEEGIITSGGINIKEINPKTMESKLVKNLYFAGEIIDVDAYTGGFNLQIAYSTGYTAGMLK